MGVIQIRRSSASLGDLPGVRAIDTSGIADTSHGALAKAAENISHGVRTAVKSIGDLAEFRMRDDERAANEAYIKADAIIQDRVYNPNNGILKSFENPQNNAASNYIRDPNTSVIDALKNEVRKGVGYSKLSGPQQRIFDEKMNADLTSIRKVLGASADKIVTTRSRNASQGMLDLYTQRCINDPSAENRALLIKAFEENARTQNLTETEAFVARVALQLKIAEGAASNVIANCQSIEDLNLVGKSLQYVRNKESYGKRADGTIKGIGWLGPLKSKDGEVVTEYSIGVEFDGVEREIPLVVPTLTQQEVDFILNELVPARNDKAKSAELRKSDTYQVIERKAIEHAKPLLESGRSPFFAGAFGEFTEAAKDLPPEMLDTLERNIKALAKEQSDKIVKAKAEAEAIALEQANQSLDNILFDLHDGKISCSEAKAKTNEIRNQYPSVSYAKFDTVNNKIDAILEGHAESAWNNARSIVDGRGETLTPTQKIAAMDALMSEEYKQTDFYKKARDMELKGLGEAYKKICEQNLDDIVNDLITNGAYSEDEALKRLDELVRVNSFYFSGVEGVDRIKKIKDTIKTNRLASVSGFRDKVARRYMNKEFVDAVLRYAGARDSHHILRPSVLLKFNANGELDVDATFSEITRHNTLKIDEATSAGAASNLKSSLLCIKATYDAVVEVAKQNPSYTAEDLYKIFDANMMGRFDENVLIQNWVINDSKISPMFDFSRLQLFLDNQAYYNSFYGVGVDAPVDLTVKNAALSKKGVKVQPGTQLPKGTQTGKGGIPNEAKAKLGDESIRSE
jgi:polyhydroxyalkanoate synthesis regulator phasin